MPTISFGPYGKFITSAVSAALAWGLIVVQSHSAAITASEWIALGIAEAGALGVYTVANTSK